MATIFFAWAGIQWMMAAGDPQKIGQARMALIGAAVGLVIVGAAFIVPEVISERIIEPAGGTAIENSAGLSCDRVLKNQLVFQRAASNADRMNAVIKQIQAQRSECAADIWDVSIINDSGGADYGSGGKIGDTDVPRGLQAQRDDPTSGPRRLSSRDAENNIFVMFDDGKRPSDSAYCWLYSARLRTWDQSYSPPV